MTFFLELSFPRTTLHVSVEASSLTEAIKLTQFWGLGFGINHGEEPQITRVDVRSKRGTTPIPLDDAEGIRNALRGEHFKDKL